jgi:hypothetical protein
VRHETVTAVFASPPGEVFDYLADVENLPEWATEFARRLDRVGDDYKVVNGLGEFFFDIRADPATGVIDMYAGPTKDAMALFPTRVVGMDGGGSAYSFTMFQAPDMPDELFDGQHAALRREFANLERRWGGGGGGGGAPPPPPPLVSYAVTREGSAGSRRSVARLAADHLALRVHPRGDRLVGDRDAEGAGGALALGRHGLSMQPR